MFTQAISESCISETVDKSPLSCTACVSSSPLITQPSFEKSLSDPDDRNYKSNLVFNSLFGKHVMQCSLNSRSLTVFFSRSALAISERRLSIAVVFDNAFMSFVLRVECFDFSITFFRV